MKELLIKIRALFEGRGISDAKNDGPAPPTTGSTPMPESPEVAVRRVIAGFPSEIWTSTTQPTYFRIRSNCAELVSADYAGKPGDLVFCYENKGGFISIKKTYPADEEAEQ